MKVFWNSCDKQLGGEMNFFNANVFKSSLENFQKSLPFWEIYVKYKEKRRIISILLYIDIGIVYSYIT